MNGVCASSISRMAIGLGLALILSSCATPAETDVSTDGSPPQNASELGTDVEPGQAEEPAPTSIGTRAGDTTPTSEHAELPATLEIVERYAAIIDNGGLLVTARVTHITMTPETFPVETVILIEQPSLLRSGPQSGALAVALTSGSALTARLHQASADELAIVELPAQAALVVSAEREVLGLAFLRNDHNFVLPGVSTDDALGLAGLAGFLKDNPLDSGQASQCGVNTPVAAPRLPTHDLDALTLALDRIDSHMTALEADRVAADLQILAEQIASQTTPTIDPVTGDHLMPSENDISRQLRDGVAADDVTIRRMIPVGIDTTGIGSDISEKNSIVVLVDSGTREVLGWTSATPFVVTETDVDEDGNPINPVHRSVNVFDVQVLAPVQPNSVDVYVLAASEAPRCPGDLDGREPNLTIPFDEIAGTARAQLVVASDSYRAYTGETP